MPYLESQNPALPPPAPTQVIWRYLDFAKLVATIRSNALRFPRADTLGDEYEGSVPPFGDDPTLGPGVAAQTSTLRKAVRKLVYVSCWTGADNESLAMWHLYSGLTSGVAIRSTVGDLIASIGDLEQTMRVAHVEYIDYQIVPKDADRNDFETWYFRKRLSFKHEQEIRAIAYSEQDLPLAIKPLRNIRTPRGIDVTADLDRLVNGLYVAPRSPDWYLRLVRGFVASTHPRWAVHRSDIDRDPIF